jgi:thymidylate kinase
MKELRRDSGTRSLKDSKLHRKMPMLWLLVRIVEDLIHLLKILLLVKIFDVVITDRYPSIDGLVDLQTKGIRFSLIYKLYKKVFPIPDIIILLDTPIEIASKRRPEHPISVLKISRSCYLYLYNTLSECEYRAKIDGTLSKSEIFNEIEKIINYVI